MELRRQRHDDGIDVVAAKQLVGGDRQAVLFAGKTLGARAVGVGDGMQGAKRLQRADMVRPQYPHPRTAIRGFIRSLFFFFRAET